MKLFICSIEKKNIKKIPLKLNPTKKSSHLASVPQVLFLHRQSPYRVVFSGITAYTHLSVLNVNKSLDETMINTNLQQCMNCQYSSDPLEKKTRTLV